MFGRKKKRQEQQEPARELYKPHQFRRGELRVMARDAILAEREKYSTFQTRVRTILFDEMVQSVRNTGSATLVGDYIERVACREGTKLGLSYGLVHEAITKEKIAEVAHLTILPFIDDGFYAYRYTKVVPERVRNGIGDFTRVEKEVTFWKVSFNDQEIRRDESRYETKRLSGPRGLGFP